MSNINNCCQDTTEIRLTVDQFIVLIFKLHESKLHLNGFNRIALESLAKELQRKLFKAIHLRYEWFHPVEAKLLNESFKSHTKKITKESATFTIPTLLKAAIGIQLDEDIPAYKQFLNKLLPYEKEWLIKDLRDVFLATTGIYCLIYIISTILNGSQILSSFNFCTLFAFSLFSTLLCFPVLYLLLFKLRSIRTPTLFKWECKVKPLQSAIAEELASLKTDFAEYKQNKISELLCTNFSSIPQENGNEEKNMKRLLYITMKFFAEAMHYVEEENSGNKKRGINSLVEDIEKLMKDLKTGQPYRFKTLGSSSRSGVNLLVKHAKELVMKENEYNKEDKFDEEFTSKIQSSIKNDPDNYNLLRSIKPKRGIHR